VNHGYAEFELNLPEALLRELTLVLNVLEPAQLTAEAVAALPKHQGIYQLLLEGDAGAEVVYIGKTDANAGLRDRLQKHYYKVQHRHGLDPDRVLFRAVRVFVFTAVDLEALLIGAQKEKTKTLWNGSGFGAKDFGIERDTTKFKPKHFDTRYSIDIDRDLEIRLPDSPTAYDVLKSLKKVVPYVFRFHTLDASGRTPHDDLVLAKVRIEGPFTTRNILRQVVEQLPLGWMATKLPSHVIMYKNDTRAFPSGELIGSSK
jgi:hypothetical protein